MKVLLVTEKCSPDMAQRDGGARLVSTLRRELKSSLSIMQFGGEREESVRWHFHYPNNSSNRFIRRLTNADFIGEKVKEVEKEFTHIIFAHISMQFGQVNFPLSPDKEVWTFPMFLTPSYRLSGENVPDQYFEREQNVLANARNILTPSYFEKEQLLKEYSVPEESIYVVPRGVETTALNPHLRSLQEPIRFCSLGSIKPQKDTIGLIRLFAKLRQHFLGSTLALIGPIQDQKYFKTLIKEVRFLNLQDSVHFLGYVSHEHLYIYLNDKHFHLSMAKCETFGRAIFETLAAGLPNIVKRAGNAAAEFLEGAPYIHFVDEDDEVILHIETMISCYESLSRKSLEIGFLFNERFLSRLLLAKIFRKEMLAISDFDGTLYHKYDEERTKRSFDSFKRFPFRVICTARGVEDILKKIAAYGLQVDWIISYSGGVVSDGEGKTLWVTPLLSDQVEALSKIISDYRLIEYDGQILQVVCRDTSQLLMGHRIERYEGETFILPWEASKLRAVHRLLNHIRWSGRVQVFGDGPSDKELIRYFDGVLINEFSTI